MATKRLAEGATVLGVAIMMALALWWRRNPSACPYGLRFSLQVSHPFVTRARLKKILEPKAGERVLEVGPGTGYHALPVARWIGPEGVLEVLDLQQEMLDHTLRQARKLDVSNIIPTQGDARNLPYPDDFFDAAYLTAVLGEVPDQAKVLCELHRVVKPGGRLIIGEALPDPHMVSFAKLRELTEVAGLEFERQLGGPLGYYARFIA